MVLLFLERANAFQMSARIEGFNLYSCGTKHCLRIQSDLAFVGMLGGNYAFDSAKIVITDKKTGKSETLVSKDTYYDFESKKIFIRGLNENLGSEAIYDLKEERLSLFNMVE